MSAGSAEQCVRLCSARFVTRSSKRGRGSQQPGAKGASESKKKKAELGELEFRLSSKFNEEEVLEEAHKYWKKKSSQCAGTLAGLGVSYPAAPSPSDFGTEAEVQRMYSSACSQWQAGSKAHQKDLLELSDLHLGLRDSQLRKKLSVEYSTQALEDRRPGHTTSPLVQYYTHTIISTVFHKDRPE